MRKERMTLKQFAETIEVKGGVVDALDYGLRVNDLTLEDQDSEFARLWMILEKKYHQMQDPMQRVEEMMEELLWE